MAEFIKIGNEITVKPKLEGISYELINNKVYDQSLIECKVDLISKKMEI